MKIALYVSEGRDQIVLTPETAMEKSLLGKMHENNIIVQIVQGAFYECRGGWTREGTGHDSTIIIMEPKPDFSEVQQ